MSTLPRIPGAAGALRLGGSFLVCAAVAGVLLGLGHLSAALGVGLGLALHLANAFFLYLTLSSLVVRGAADGSTRRAAAIASLSSVGRLLLLGFVLWWIAATLGRETALGAGGGLALAQISLFFRRSGAEGGA
ncbi:MAG: hypothetical protein NTV92_08520 [Candidatus Bipolaricaulota bacterium]|nr:hypothetical protein [Candidatus Bipolaricaulota bacterium]